MNTKIINAKMWLALQGDTLVTIDDAVRGVPYRCLACHVPVVVNHGVLGTWHFAHAFLSTCDGDRRRQVLSVIADAVRTRPINLPAPSVILPDRWEHYCKDKQIAPPSTGEETVQAEDVTVACGMIRCMVDGAACVIEVAAWPVDDSTVAHCRAAGVSIITLDIDITAHRGEIAVACQRGRWRVWGAGEAWAARLQQAHLADLQQWQVAQHAQAETRREQRTREQQIVAAAKQKADWQFILLREARRRGWTVAETDEALRERHAIQCVERDAEGGTWLTELEKLQNEIQKN